MGAWGRENFTCNSLVIAYITIDTWCFTVVSCPTVVLLTLMYVTVPSVFGGYTVCSFWTI